MKYKLKDIGTIITGTTPKTKNKDYYNSKDFLFVGPTDLKIGKYVRESEKYVSLKAYNDYSSRFIGKNSLMIDCIGSDMGNVALSVDKVLTNQQINSITDINENNFNVEFLYYLFSTMKKYFHQIGTNGSTMPIINKTMFEEIEVEIPNKVIQDKIAYILSKIDMKIDYNIHTNNNLLELIDVIYKENISNINKFKKANEIADITIGKTPPRKIKECFSFNDEDIKWLSISDLGKCGMYVWNTNEKLTQKAIDEYNVIVIPENTIVLSFKLTVGRIAITANKMATNEAIAHFNLKDQTMLYYLYCYLKNFDYRKLGSTSSIATAVNSKIIKEMPIGIPDGSKLYWFNEKIKPLFEKIKLNESENRTLEQLRETLLPKLMNGEIDIDKIEI